MSDVTTINYIFYHYDPDGWCSAYQVVEYIKSINETYVLVECPKPGTYKLEKVAEQEIIDKSYEPYFHVDTRNE